MSCWAALALILAATPAWADTHFFAAIDDLPLAPGLAETDTGFEFDGAAGRIVEASATGTATSATVRQFYADSLPALGWAFSPSVGGPMLFLRGREQLSLTLHEQAGAVWLDARLITRPASMRVD